MPGAWLNNLQFHPQFQRKTFNDLQGKKFDFNQLNQGFCNSSGSFAMFAAIPRASSLLSSLVSCDVAANKHVIQSTRRSEPDLYLAPLPSGPSHSTYDTRLTADRLMMTIRFMTSSPTLSV